MFNFFKNTFLTGLLVLLPLVLLFLVLREIFGLMVDIATPIVDLFPEGTFDTEHQINILAALIIICTALMIGILAKIPASRVAGSYISERTVAKLPIYRMLRTVTSAFLEIEESTSFKPALISNDSGGMEPAYIIEGQGQPLIVVMVPWSPTAFAGVVKLVPRERVHKLPLTLDEFSLSLSNYGLGLTEILYEEQGNLKTSVS
jgi:uncharacterized membrane protein